MLKHGESVDPTRLLRAITAPICIRWPIGDAVVHRGVPWLKFWTTNNGAEVVSFKPTPGFLYEIVQGEGWRVVPVNEYWQDLLPPEAPDTEAPYEARYEEAPEWLRIQP